MNLKELKEIDTGIELAYPSSWDGKVETLTTAEHPQNEALLFIKSKSFLEKAQKNEHKIKLSKQGALVLKELWHSSSDVSKLLMNMFDYILIVEDIEKSMVLLSKSFYDKRFSGENRVLDGRQAGTVDIDPTCWIGQNVFIGEHAKIEKDVVIHPGCVIGVGARIGSGSEIFSNVSLYHNVSIGKNCRVHAGTIIGSDGFGYHFANGEHQKVWHFGGVEIHDDVEIGSLTSIDAGTFSPTIIEKGCKIDNQVQIAHNCHIKEKVIMCGQSGLAGSVTLGAYCVLAGRVAVGPGITLGEGCTVAGQAFVSSDWPAKKTLAGNPARLHREWIKGIAHLRKISLKK